MRISHIYRGVDDLDLATDFFAWLLDLVPESEDDSVRFQCRNGDLTLTRNASTPVAFGLIGSRCDLPSRDPDGVPVLPGDGVERADIAVALDHVRANCADISTSLAYYRRLGFELTWSGNGDEVVEGLHEQPVTGVDWIHLSGADGYLSLSQADWGDYGRHSIATGPPRFIHIGFAVPSLGDVIERLHDAGTPFLHSTPDDIGDRVYLNDPEGNPRRGTNIEIVEYRPGAARSGQAPLP